MIRRKYAAPVFPTSIPRESGDDPRKDLENLENLEYSPRERG